MPTDRAPVDQALALHRVMARIRAFEDTCLQLNRQGRLRGGLHLSIGQEAVAAGICAGLRADDLMTTTHRGHGHCLAKGGNAQGMADELVGRASGYCKGRGGSMHLADAALGMLGANAIVGAGIPIAAGAALSAAALGDDRIAVAIFGEGAVAQGVFHESLNLAALWALPVIFVCENNLYAEMTPSSLHLSNPSVAAYGAPYGLAHVAIDGNDVALVARTMDAAVARARGGGGATLIECNTYRLQGHFAGDLEAYRSKKEVAEWATRDPLLQSRAVILAQDPTQAAALDRMAADATAEMAAVFERAFAAAPPDPACLLEDVYA